MGARYPYYLLADSPEGIKKLLDEKDEVEGVKLPQTADHGLTGTVGIRRGGGRRSGGSQAC